MQVSPFTSAFSKLARARKHIDDLRAAIAAFIATQPYEVVSEEEISTGALVYKLRVCRAVPGDWSLIVGDALHNMRSALDHLAWRLVELNNKTPHRGTQFIICEDQAAFQRRVAQHALDDMGQAAKTFIENLHPYRGGDDPIWQLNELENIDKHRLLIDTDSMFHSLQLVWGFAVPGQSGNAITLPFPLQPEKFIPLRQGADVFRVEKAARHHYDPAFPIHLQEPVFNIKIGFAGGVVLAGEPVVEKLEEMYTRVEEILRLADQHFGTPTI